MFSSHKTNDQQCSINGMNANQIKTGDEHFHNSAASGTFSTALKELPSDKFLVLHLVFIMIVNSAYKISNATLKRTTLKSVIYDRILSSVRPDTAKLFQFFFASL